MSEQSDAATLAQILAMVKEMKQEQKTKIDEVLVLVKNINVTVASNEYKNSINAQIADAVVKPVEKEVDRKKAGKKEVVMATDSAQSVPDSPNPKAAGSSSDTSSIPASSPEQGQKSVGKGTLNILSFFKEQIGQFNYCGARHKIITPELIQTLTSAQKATIDKRTYDSPDYWRAMATAVWNDVKSNEKAHAEVKRLFAQYKETCNAEVIGGNTVVMANQLEEDNE